MAGVTAVVLVSPAVPAQELDVVRSAARAGVRHIVKASSKASADSPIARRRGQAEISYEDVAAVLSTLVGRAITYREISFEADRDAMIAAGLPAPIAEMNALAATLSARGDAAWTSEDVPSLLGRRARSLAQFAADYATAFA